MGATGDDRRRRLRQLCDLAKAYRHLPHEQLARRLGRHHDRIVPDNGNPKLDYLVALSSLLDWPLSLVITYVWGNGAGGQPGAEARGEQGFDALQAASRQAHVEGRFELAVSLAQRAYRAARTPDQRVVACIREASGHDGLGKFADALEAEQRGLMETSVAGELRRQLESNLANAYYTLWALPEAESLALKLIRWYQENRPATYKDRVTEAFALYVHGGALRRMMTIDPGHSTDAAGQAEVSLAASRRLFLEIGREFGEDWCGGIANTLEGGLIQVEVALGRRDAGEALREIDGRLEAVIDPADGLAGDWLESYGWWCIFGCYIAQRHLADEPLVQQYLAKFTDKADVIARRLDNWALRERVFSLEYAGCERVERLTGRRALLTLDDEDLEALVGVVGRFPRFGPTGLKLFDAHVASMRLAV